MCHIKMFSNIVVIGNTFIIIPPIINFSIQLHVPIGENGTIGET